jgi:hypothetical protein
VDEENRVTLYGTLALEDEEDESKPMGTALERKR